MDTVQTFTENRFGCRLFTIAFQNGTATISAVLSFPWGQFLATLKGLSLLGAGAIGPLAAILQSDKGKGPSFPKHSSPLTKTTSK